MVSSDSIESVDETSLSHDLPMTSSEILDSPPLAITADQRSCDNEVAQEVPRQKQLVRLRLKRAVAKVDMATDDNGSSASKVSMYTCLQACMH